MFQPCNTLRPISNRHSRDALDPCPQDPCQQRGGEPLVEHHDSFSLFGWRWAADGFHSPQNVGERSGISIRVGTQFKQSVDSCQIWTQVAIYTDPTGVTQKGRKIKENKRRRGKHLRRHLVRLASFYSFVTSPSGSRRQSSPCMFLHLPFTGARVSTIGCVTEGRGIGHSRGRVA